MPRFWNSPLQVWKTALSSYTDSLPPKPDLSTLDTFMNDLRSTVPTREPPHLTAPEYRRLVTWKLTRGKSRPRLQAFANALSDSVVKSATTAAFEHLANGDDRAALRALTEMKGCGPATASAVLALCGACFMSDEALELVLGQRKYTERAFLDLQERAKEKSEELGDGWALWEVERAVYAGVRLGLGGDGGGKTDKGAGGARRKKRTREEPVAQDDDIRPKKVDKGKKEAPAAKDEKPIESEPVGRRRSQRLLARK